MNQFNLTQRKDKSASYSFTTKQIVTQYVSVFFSRFIYFVLGHGVNDSQSRYNYSIHMSIAELVAHDFVWSAGIAS